jgi:hypothetical protein
MKFSGFALAPFASLGFFGCLGPGSSHSTLARSSRSFVLTAQPQPGGKSALASSQPSERKPASPPWAPTWSDIYARYFSPNSDGACGHSPACHIDVMGDSESAYAWLAQWGYIAGTQSPLVSRTNSCLIWFGGNMPPRGAPNDAAVRDLIVWVAAGAPRN